MNSAVVTHSDEIDPEGGKAIVRALVRANPAIKVLLLVSGIEGSVEKTKSNLAKAYGVPAGNIVPVNVGDSSGGDTVSLWPQDGFLAGKAGLIRPAAPLRHAGEAAQQVGTAIGVPVRSSDGVGMGGDTKFLTRPDGTQVSYFGRDTILLAADALNATGQPRLDGDDPEDRLVVIGHVMSRMARAGVNPRNVMPVGVGRETYGQVLARLTPAQRSRIEPSVLTRLEEMKGLPFPSDKPTSADGFDYHTDLLMASPDGKTMFVNEDDLRTHPQIKTTLNAFGYKAVPLPAAHDGRDSIRVSYTNLVMGRLPNGKLSILLPSETVDASRPSSRDGQALAAVRREFPQAEVSLIGGASARMQIDRNWGPHCRTNVLPYLIEDAPRPKAVKEPPGAAGRSGLF